MRTPPPLSPALEALLAPHRKMLPLAASVEARALARAAATEESLERGAGRAIHRPFFAFAVAAAVVLTLAAGAYAARAWMGAAGAPEPVPATPTARALAPEPVVARAPAAAPVVSVAPPAAQRQRRIAARTSATAAPARPSNEELQLLRAARQDVTRGDYARALEVLGEHARRFRQGSLIEEREALRIKSLAGLGRREEAQRAAAAFHARFPHSVFLSTFERMKQTEP